MFLPTTKKSKGSGDFIPGSKTNRLLGDIPLDERCVVFSSNKAYVLHLALVLDQVGIGNCSLYTAQNNADNSEALTRWKDPGMKHRVLIVQSGAAASGLTLVEASKIFIMDPMLHAEEEQQIHGRCHRFGQKRPVEVVTYFTPVSCESRILSLRSDINKNSRGGGGGGGGRRG